MRGSLLLAAALVALATSGCLGLGGGDGGEAPSAVEQAVGRLAGPDPATLPGSIQGAVTTPALEPIPGARVTLLRENVSTRADGAGFFRFAGLKPGSYMLAAEAEGFATRTVLARAANGTVTELNLTLAPAPRPEPRHETRELAGFLSCGAEATTPQGVQRVDCAAADPNHRDRFEMTLAPGGKRVVLELAWSAEDNPGATRLRLAAETVGYGASDLHLGEAVGEGYARLVVPVEVLEKYYPEGGAMRALVSMVSDGTPPVSVAAQTRFTVYATVFYVEPGPEEFAVASA